MILPHGVPCRHGTTACIITRGVATDPTRSASLYSGTRSACGDLRSHDAGVASTAAPDLAELLTPPIKPPAPARPAVRGARGGRGGHPGRPGSPATRIPAEEADGGGVPNPAQCTHCQPPLAGAAPKPWRHQVIEIPPFKPVVTEYQWHQLACPA